MRKYWLILFLIFLTAKVQASIKENIIKNFNSIDNLTFDFEQNINGKVEKGNCTLQYPKKIFCKYDLSNQKILVSDGRSMVIKTKSSFYLYPLEKTALKFILNKDYLLNKIKYLDERTIDNKFINYKLVESNYEINIFFDKKNLNLIGWQTIDIYQNLSITFLSSIIKNRKLKKDLFKLPIQN